MIQLGSPDEERRGSDKARIEQLVMDQHSAWNKGDLNAYLAGYSRSKDLTYTAGGAIHRGFEAMQRCLYRDAGRPLPSDQNPAAAPSIEASLGALELAAPLEIVLLGLDSAWVLGTVRRVPSGSGAPELTTFTMVLRRTAGHGTRWEGWRVTHMHATRHAAAPVAALANGHA
eukprot:TRINITY_DN4911_c0_g1_i1.p2 TRINITY_DN4911_c0_g1~~TRINITY_DN4911_c0_g1_i1.p2  ORF type:complete len:172 (-),score=45.07 TRINITY_DN4911_c0_g1_i1:382-897(-)